MTVSRQFVLFALADKSDTHRSSLAQCVTSSQLIQSGKVPNDVAASELITSNVLPVRVFSTIQFDTFKGSHSPGFRRFIVSMESRKRRTWSRSPAAATPFFA